MSKMSTKRQWRKLVKKLRRKRERQKFAQERDRDLEKEQLAKLTNPLYKEQAEQQERLEQLQRQAEENERNECEEQWLRRELLAQKHFRREEQKRIAKEKVEEELRQQQENRLREQEESIRRRREDIKKKSEQAAKEFEESMQLLDNYLEDSGAATPPRLQKSLESRPSEKLCEFYRKTNCCRFGLGCIYNHQMPMLSNTILIKHFFQHSLMENRRNQEYASADENLEVSENDCQEDYEEFCADVWPEMESFGVIVNFRTVRNKLAHTRGHVFVQYADKRSALKAFIKLQNRYYASKPLKVEFSHITHWRTAVCDIFVTIFKGLSLAHKCPKGDSCNYLHLLRNPGNKYNTPLEVLTTPHSSCRSLGVALQTPLNWNDVVALEDTNKSCRWRWSESPEIEIKSKTENMTSAACTKDANKSHHLKLSVCSKEKHTKRSRETSLEISQRKTLEFCSVQNNNHSRKIKHKHYKQSSSEDKRKRKHKSHKRSSSKEKRKRKHRSHSRSPCLELYKKSKHKSHKQSASEERHKKSGSDRKSSQERHKAKKECTNQDKTRSHSREQSRKR